MFGLSRHGCKPRAARVLVAALVAVAVSTAVFSYFTYVRSLRQERAQVAENRVELAVALAAFADYEVRRQSTEVANELLRSFWEARPKRFPGTEMKVVDAGGAVLFATSEQPDNVADRVLHLNGKASSIGDLVAAQTIGIGDYVDSQSVEQLISFAPVPVLRAKLMVLTPAAAVDVQTHERAAKSAAVFGFSAGLLLATNVAGAYFMVRRTLLVKATAAARVAESRRWSHEALMHVPVPIFTQAGGRIRLANEALRDMLGYESADAFVGRDVFELFHPEMHDTIRARIAKLQSGARTVEPIEERMLRADGASVVAEVAARRHELDGAAVILVTCRDLTQEKERNAAEAVARIERDALLARLRAYFERMPIACISFDARQSITDWNPAAEKIFGFTRDEALGRHPVEFMVPERAHTALRVALASVAEDESPAPTTNENLTKSGRTLVCEWHNSPLCNERGVVVGCLSMVIDITERRRLEDQLRQAQKMEALGVLAGGVAHDFNNVLTVVLAQCELAAMELRCDHPALDAAAASIDHIQQAGLRAAALTKQLLSFSRTSVALVEPIHVNKCVEDAQQLLQRLIGEDVRLRFELGGDLPRVLADAAQLGQVLMNLAVNARDAMPRGGELTISTGTIDVTAGSPEARTPGELGRHVEVCVRDTGTGIDPAVLGRIFEPFFTTKSLGTGTGLGLSTAYGIVRQAGGRLLVESKLGSGTTFRVLLPATDAVPNESFPPAAAPSKGGGETILLCEDDVFVRDITSALLLQGGYKVLVARHASEAMEYVHGGAVIDLLLTDVIMPDVNGRQLADAFIKARPKARVMFMSGYTAEIIARRGVDAAEIDVMEKPFTPEMLYRRVREALGRASAKPVA